MKTTAKLLEHYFKVRTKLLLRKFFVFDSKDGPVSLQVIGYLSSTGTYLYQSRYTKTLLDLRLMYSKTLLHTIAKQSVQCEGSAAAV